MSYLIQLLAGLAFGTGMLMLTIFVFCIILPVLVKQIRGRSFIKRPEPETRDYIFSFFEALAYSVLIVGIGIFLFYEFIEFFPGMQIYKRIPQHRSINILFPITFHHLLPKLSGLS